jgi:glutamyl/glutaminyl-tRNA synthetase
MPNLILLLSSLSSFYSLFSSLSLSFPFYYLAKAKADGAAGEGGAFIVRIEDTDIARSTKESEISVLSDLAWLGLNFDEGPDKAIEDASFGPYRQSERGEIYTAIANSLIEAGYAYPCFCSDEELAAEKEEQEAKAPGSSR